VAVNLPLVRKWQYISEYEFTGTPVGGRGKIILLTRQGWVVCLSSDGKELWKKRMLRDTGSGGFTNAVFSSSAAYSSGIIAACSEDGSVFGISANDGSQLWRYAAGAPVHSAPVIHESGVLILTRAEGRVHCIDLEKGTGIWISDKYVRADGGLAVCSGRVVYGNCNANLVFIDRNNGKTAGVVEFGEGHEVAGTPACADGKVYVGTRSGSLMCVDILKQKLLRKNEIGGGELFAPPAVIDKSVLISEGDFSLLRLGGGASGWKYKSDSIITPPVVSGGSVFLLSGGMLVTLNAEDGKSTGAVKCGSTDFPPAIIDGMVVVAGDDGSIYCFGAE